MTLCQLKICNHWNKDLLQRSPQNEERKKDFVYYDLTLL